MAAGGREVRKIRSEPGMRTHVARYWRDHRWLLLGLLWMAVTGFGMFGFASYRSPDGPAPGYSLLDLLYRSLQLFTLDSGAVDGPPGWPLETARWLAPALTVLTAVQALRDIFDEQLQVFHMRQLQRHVVICGLGEKGRLLALAFRACGLPVVVLDREPEQAVKLECRRHGIIVLAGDATTLDALEQTRFERARYVLAVCGDDRANAQIAGHVRRARAEAELGGGPHAAVHLHDPELCRSLPGDGAVGFFNAETLAAAALLNGHPFNTAGAEESAPHILVAGPGPLAEAVVAEAASQWDKLRPAAAPALRVSLVGWESTAAHEAAQEIAARVAPLQVHFAGTLAQWREASSAAGPEAETPSAVYVCCAEESHALATALWLCRAPALQSSQLVLALMRPDGVDSLLEFHPDTGPPPVTAGGASAPPATAVAKAWEGAQARIQLFPVLLSGCRPAFLFREAREQLAQVIHEHYRAANPRLDPAQNPAALPWDELPEALRGSNRQQAEHVVTRLHGIGYGLSPLPGAEVEDTQFSSEDIERLAQQEHERWRHERERQGWRYAPTRDNAAKTNPLLLPWDQLSNDAKEANRRDARALPELLRAVDFCTYRLPQ